MSFTIPDLILATFKEGQKFERSIVHLVHSLNRIAISYGGKKNSRKTKKNVSGSK